MRADVQVRLARGRRTDPECLVRHPDVERVAIRVRVDRDGGDAEIPAGADDPDGDLPSVGDEDLPDGSGSPGHGVRLARASERRRSRSRVADLRVRPYLHGIRGLGRGTVMNRTARRWVGTGVLAGAAALCRRSGRWAQSSGGAGSSGTGSLGSPGSVGGNAGAPMGTGTAGGSNRPGALGPGTGTARDSTGAYSGTGGAGTTTGSDGTLNSPSPSPATSGSSAVNPNAPALRPPATRWVSRAPARASASPRPGPGRPPRQGPPGPADATGTGADRHGNHGH